MPERPPSDLKRVTAQYHAAVQGLQDNALADLQGRWQGVQATLDLKIKRLTDAIAAAQARGETVNVAWLTQAQRLEQLRAAVQGDVSAFADGAADIVQNAIDGAADLGQAAAQAALAATVPPGVNFTFGVPPADVAEELAAALQPGSPLAALFDQLGPLVAAFAQQALFTGVALGEGPRQIAQRLSWATDMAARRAEVIARTETMRAWRHAQFANYQANRDVVQQWMWAADFGPRCCGACIAMDGTFHSVDTELDDHICGRCSAIPITRSWADILADGGMSQAEIEALDLTETSGMAWAQSRESGESWLARQSVEIQNQILGPAKAEAWRQGAFPLERVVGVVHDPQWGSSIRELSLRQMGLDAQTWLQAARQAGNDSVLADADALAAAHAETSVSVAAQQEAERVAEAKAAADEWYAAIERSIAEGRAGGLTAEEAKAAADEWFQQVRHNLPPGGLSTTDIAREMERRFGFVANPAETAAETEAETAASTEAAAVGETLTGDALRAEAAQMRELIDPALANEGTDLQAVLRPNYEHQQAIARALADNPDWQRWVAATGRDQSFEFEGFTYTPEMQAVGILEDSWTALVMDEAPVNVALRDAAQQVFHLDLPPRTIDPSVRAQADEFLAEHGGALRAYVQAVYDQSQQWFADHGIEEITLYRGSSGKTAADGLRYEGEAARATVQGAAFSSYSVDPSLAYSFASGTGYQAGEFRRMMAVRVPVSEVFGTPFTSMAKQGESEFLLFGNAHEASVLSWKGEAAPALDTALDRLAGEIPTTVPEAEAAASTEATTVTYASDDAAARLALAFPQLDTLLTEEQVANLAGAPAGSTVTVSRHREITVTPPDGRYTSSVFVMPGEDGPTLLNWQFMAPDGSNSIAVDPEALAAQVREANALGIDSIHMKARIHSTDYTDLPQLGYNAPIEQVLTESRDHTLPAGLEHAQTLLDVLATPEGRAWWAANGLNPGLDFDPHPGSLSRQILDTYLRDHGLPGLDVAPAATVAAVAETAEAPNTAVAAIEQAQQAQQALDDAQAQLNAVTQEWSDRLTQNKYAGEPDGLLAAKWEVARAQAAADAAQGGKGIILNVDSSLASPSDPFGQARLDEISQAMFGRTLSRDELAALVGAPSGSYVSVYASGDLNTLEIGLHGPSWDPTNPLRSSSEYDADRELMLSRGQVIMNNETFFLADDLQGSGMGAQVFSEQVQALSDLGVRRIDTFGAGEGEGVLGQQNTSGTNGYYSWPRFGYLGSLPQRSLDAIQEAIANGTAPAAWSKYTTIQQLMRTPAGRDWWKANGEGLALSFDLRPDSLSMRLLNAYRREKGLA